MAIERRSVLELRAAGRKLEGVAAPFAAEARIQDFIEVIRAGAFSETLADGHDIVGLVDHDTGKLLARTRNGSLRLTETRQGLEFSLDLPSTTLGADVLAMAENRLLGGMSFAFRVRRPNGEKWEGRRRELRAVDLLEISVISSFAVYSATEVHARCRPPMRLCMAQRYLETC
jgi:uncharacterized protein